MKYGTVSRWMIVLLGFPQTALAAWGENWGEMVWGVPVAVPTYQLQRIQPRVGFQLRRHYSSVLTELSSRTE